MEPSREGLSKFYMVVRDALDINRWKQIFRSRCKPDADHDTQIWGHDQERDKTFDILVKHGVFYGKFRQYFKAFKYSTLGVTFFKNLFYLSKKEEC